MITSLRNTQVQAARKLAKRTVRDSLRQFLIEGPNGVERALSTGAPLVCIFVEGPDNGFPELTRLARAGGLQVFTVSDAVMRAMSSTTTPPGILAICRFVDRDPAALLRNPPSLGVVLAGVRDPGNAGTILRSSAAAGADAIFLGAETVDLYNPKLVRATVGALFDLPICRNVEIPWLLQEFGNLGVQRVAADPSGEAVYDQVDFRRRTALVLGNEAWGVPAELAAAVDARVSIPMSKSVESLNVGMAATVLLFEAARQRRAAR
ncbi:MAG TPA: RNA methyltransferase [Actinomycetota bacterium]|nr:RNA methyltransferase [Actinomycetota bacterium]